MEHIFRQQVLVWVLAFGKSIITPAQSRCTYLKLCGSINDASWDDEYRIVQGENRSTRRREVSRERQRKRENMTWSISHFSSRRTFTGPESLMWTSKMRWRKRLLSPRGYSLSGETPTLLACTLHAIFQPHKCYNTSCSEKQGMLWQCRNKAAVRFNWTKPWGRLQHTSKLQ